MKAEELKQRLLDLVFYREPKDNDIVYLRLSILCEFVQQYAAEVSRESHETFMKTLDIKEDRKAIRKLRRFIIQFKE